MKNVGVSWRRLVCFMLNIDKCWVNVNVGCLLTVNISSWLKNVSVCCRNRIDGECWCLKRKCQCFIMNISRVPYLREYSELIFDGLTIHVPSQGT